MDQETERALKTLFAEEWLRTRHPHLAAAKCFPDDGGTAVLIAPQWAKDDYVLSQVERIRESKDEMDMLPTKGEVAREIWKMATEVFEGSDVHRAEPKDRLAALKLYAELRGYIAGKQVNNNTTNNTLTDNSVTENKVMVVREFTNMTEWAKGLRERQKLLTDVAAAN